MAPDISYCLDTSALFDAGIRWYPPDAFPSFWEKLEELAAKQRLVIPSLVVVEATKKTHHVAKWVQQIKKDAPHVVVDADAAVQLVVAAIARQYPDWTAKGRNQADPFVVATAKAKGLVVVTGEHPSKSLTVASPTRQHKLKIPNICDEQGVSWLGVPDMIKAEGWRF